MRAEIISFGLIALGLCFVGGFDPRKVHQRRLAAAIVVLLLVRFTAWHLLAVFTQSNGESERVLSLLFLVLELPIVLGAVTTARALVPTSDRRAQADQNALWWETVRAAPPVIDILIPTYDEPGSVVERSIIGAMTQNYPNFRVWVLDDGNRMEIEHLAARHGANYMTRNNNVGAKAGNLNAALARLLRDPTAPEFVAVFDADFVALPGFLSRVLSLFRDDRVGLVQTPQAFFNRDHFQKCCRIVEVPTHLQYAFDVRMPSNDAAGLASCLGTSFLVRAEALREIGGFATESVVENITTSIQLRAAGWEIAYLNESLSFGIAPEGLEEHEIQRRRWALGLIQIAMRSWRSSRGRSLFRKLRGMETHLRFVLGPLNQCALLIVPPMLFWFFHIRILPDSSEGIISYGASAFIAYRLFLRTLGPGKHIPFYYEAIQLLNIPANMQALAHGIRDTDAAARFEVTPKGRTFSARRFHSRKALAVILAIITMSVGLYLASAGEEAGAHSKAAEAMLIWTSYALICLIIALFFCYEGPRRRREERFHGAGRLVRMSFRDESVIGELRDISVYGATIACPTSGRGVGETARLELSDGETLDANIVRLQDPGIIAVELQHDFGERRRLIRALYSLSYIHPVGRLRVLAPIVSALRARARNTVPRQDARDDSD